MVHVVDEHRGADMVRVRTGSGAMGWLRGPSNGWRFHADVQNAATCMLAGADASGPEGKPGFCCHD